MAYPTQVQVWAGLLSLLIKNEVDFDPFDCAQVQTALQSAQDRQCNSRYCDACKNTLLRLCRSIVRRNDFGVFAQCWLSVSKHVNHTKKWYRA